MKWPLITLLAAIGLSVFLIPPPTTATEADPLPIVTLQPPEGTPLDRLTITGADAITEGFTRVPARLVRADYRKLDPEATYFARENDGKLAVLVRSETVAHGISRQAVPD